MRFCLRLLSFLKKAVDYFEEAVVAKKKKYSVPLSPIPWKRPGVSENGFFDAQKREKLAFSLYLEQQHKEAPLFSSPISLDVVFYMKIPLKNKSRQGVHFIKPDIDNLCKFLLDSIVGTLITDDRIIWSLSAKKIYDSNPRTEFVITTLD